MQVLATDVFERNWNAYYNTNKRIISNQGSTRSSKTYSIIQLLILICLDNVKNVSIVSCTIPHLKRGARKDFLEIMQVWNIYKDKNFNKTDNIYFFDNGSKIEFFSADNADKLRGSRRDILYINEANLITFGAYRQLAIRTTQRIFIDFNPADDDNFVYALSDNIETTEFIKSTYKSNPFLTQEQVQEIENMNPEKNELGDENLWKVYGLGERGASNLTIYTHTKTYSKIPEGTADVFYGLDFGYHDPTALVKVSIIKGGYYVEELLYEKGLTNGELISKMKNIVDKNLPIYCDSAEPARIQELNLNNFWALKSSKEVKQGIVTLKSLPLYLHQDSTNLQKEFKNYKWRVGKDEKPLEEPNHFYSHLPDATRYAIYTHYKRFLL